MRAHTSTLLAAMLPAGGAGAQTTGPGAAGPVTDVGVPAGNAAEQAAPTIGIAVPGGFTLTGLGAATGDYVFRGITDYLRRAVGFQREIALGVTATVDVYGTDISKRDCVPVPDRATGGQRICVTRSPFTHSRAF